MAFHEPMYGHLSPGSNIVSTILVTMFITVVMLGYDWWLRMVINISVQYSGGLLPGIILLTQGYYQWGTRLNTM